MKENAVALFGGSFDPIQSDHVDIVKKLQKRFYKTVVVPTYISPFKKTGSFVSAKDRLAMVQIALKDENSVEVSDFEIKKEDISYSFDTIEHFANVNQGKQIFVALGSEMLQKLPKWHRFDELKEMVHFYVIERKGFAIKSATLRRLTKLGANIEVADFTGSDISSAHARVDIAFNKFHSLPKAVASYIKDNKLYQDYKCITGGFEVFDLSKERIKHTYQTTLAAVSLAKRYNANIHDTVTAALLHDIAKEADSDVFESLGVPPLPEVYQDVPKKVRHAFIGAEAARAFFGIRKKSVLDAVRFHTTGAPKMGKVAKIVYLADKIESSRDKEEGNLDELRELIFTNLNKGMIEVLERNVARMRKKGREVYPLTTATLEFFLSKRKPKVGADIDRPKKDIELGEFIPLQKTPPTKDGTELANRIAVFLDEKKARDITLIAIAHKTVIADYFILCTASSTTAVSALTDYIDERLSKDFNIEPLRRDLDPKWSAVDYGDVILHIQTEDIRNFYDLERLWFDGDNVKRF
ncbi:MAG: nicotinate (nicotinamide) nucleotide adenylyltransferase [Firmicutes bacterium]|nr:nicotinate (nicotinamide) nucleotide adenylyltransferase [Bacillota bacterium]